MNTTPLTTLEAMYRMSKTDKLPYSAPQTFESLCSQLIINRV